MELGAFRSSLDDWLEHNSADLVPGHPAGDTLDGQMAQPQQGQASHL